MPFTNQPASTTIADGPPRPSQNYSTAHTDPITRPCNVGYRHGGTRRGGGIQYEKCVLRKRKSHHRPATMSLRFQAVAALSLDRQQLFRCQPRLRVGKCARPALTRVKCPVDVKCTSVAGSKTERESKRKRTSLSNFVTPIVSFFESQYRSRDGYNQVHCSHHTREEMNWIA
jgi:hypothetical protein